MIVLDTSGYHTVSNPVVDSAALDPLAARLGRPVDDARRGSTTRLGRRAATYPPWLERRDDLLRSVETPHLMNSVGEP
jgi:hypothetical protein